MNFRKIYYLSILARKQNSKSLQERFQNNQKIINSKIIFEIFHIIWNIWIIYNTLKNFITDIKIQNKPKQCLLMAGESRGRKLFRSHLEHSTGLNVIQFWSDFLENIFFKSSNQSFWIFKSRIFHSINLVGPWIKLTAVITQHVFLMNTKMTDITVNVFRDSFSEMAFVWRDTTLSNLKTLLWTLVQGKDRKNTKNTLKSLQMSEYKIFKTSSEIG